MLTDPTDVGRLDGHRDFDLAVPTPDHFLPLLYVAGVAGATGAPVDVLVDGYAYGSLSMTAYTLGISAPAPPPPTAGGRTPSAAMVSASEPRVVRTSRWVAIDPSLTTATGVAGSRPFCTSAAAMAP